MSKSVNELMAEYGITCKTKTIFSYKHHTYDKFSDALQYAKTDMNRYQKTITDNNTASSKHRVG